MYFFYQTSSTVATSLWNLVVLTKYKQPIMKDINNAHSRYHGYPVNEILLYNKKMSCYFRLSWGRMLSKSQPLLFIARLQTYKLKLMNFILNYIYFLATPFLSVTSRFVLISLLPRAIMFYSITLDS